MVADALDRSKEIERLDSEWEKELEQDEQTPQIIKVKLIIGWLLLLCTIGFLIFVASLPYELPIHLFVTLAAVALASGWMITRGRSEHRELEAKRDCYLAERRRLLGDEAPEGSSTT